jgi:CRP/FNR family transcriptional regulator, dissimilatory nitrate respiration regulator
MNDMKDSEIILRAMQTAPILSKARLFQNISAQELESLLDCLGASFGKFEKGQYLLSAGDPVRQIGILLTGAADILKEDAFGRRSIVTSIGPLDMFAEALVCAQVEVSPVSVQATADGTICFLDYKRIVTSCGSACGFHTRLVQNMLGILAYKNILFNKKMDYLLMKSMRERVSAYLLDQSAKRNSLSFTIPFNREELADFLAVDRSAMSRELGRMKQEGLIDFNKNKFVLLKSEKMI